MNFNSLQYLLFLPIVVTFYYLLRPRWRNYLLLAASYFFYMCWNPAYALLMLSSTVITFGCGLLLERRQWGRRKTWLALSLALNLAILFFFKYFNFFFGLLGDIFAEAGLAFETPLLQVLLPMGISFYTFQALGYTIDVYRGQTKAEHNFAIYALFVSFFPQLVAGPIERSGNLLPQFREPHRFELDNLQEGMLPLLWGMFKKVVLADQLAVLVNTAYAAPHIYSGQQLILATVAFALQIYCDFSAYSDIARGSARMLGFRLMVNFNRPYFAVSIRDFWRRWHISLSSWFKDYLYFPLGGSRRGPLRNQLNVLIVFAVSGLWHGAAITYLVWGLQNGFYQIISGWLKPLKSRLLRRFKIGEGNRLLHLVRILITFALVCSTWVFFRAESVAAAITVYRVIFYTTFSRPLTLAALTALGLSLPQLIQLGICLLALLVVDYFSQRPGFTAAINRRLAPRYLLYFLIIAVILLFGSYGLGFNPQDFVYFQF